MIKTSNQNEYKTIYFKFNDVIQFFQAGEY